MYRNTLTTIAAVFVLTINFIFSQVVINEIMYNPPGYQGSDYDYEFMELHNPGTVDIDMSGFSFTQGVNHVFAGVDNNGDGDYIDAGVDNNGDGDFDDAGVDNDGDGLFGVCSVQVLEAAEQVLGGLLVGPIIDVAALVNDPSVAFCGGCRCPPRTAFA